MKNSFLYIIIVFLLVSLVLSNMHHRDSDMVEKTIIVTDTIETLRTDTIVIKKPRKVQTIVRDTMVAKNAVGDSLKLIYSSKIYQDSLYKAYVSGYNANLDSIHVYNKTFYKTITNTIDRTIYKQKYNLYLECGASTICGTIAPNAGLSLSTPQGLIFGGTMGLYDRRVFYGIKVGYRIK